MRPFLAKLISFQSEEDKYNKMTFNGYKQK